jgi:YjbE family integral membrane protein
MMIELIIIFFQIIFIDLVLAADNVLIVGMVASKFGKNKRKKIRNWGIAVAVLTRVILTFIIALIVLVYFIAIAPFFLQFPPVTFIFGLFLFYIAYTLYENIIKIEKKQKIKTRKFSFFKGMMIVLIADLGMSLKNVSVIMAAAREHYLLLFLGLILSIFFLATMATYIPLWVKKYKWIGWLGLFAVLMTATELTVMSLVDYGIFTWGGLPWLPDIGSIFKSWIY